MWACCWRRLRSSDANDELITDAAAAAAAAAYRPKCAPAWMLKRCLDNVRTTRWPVSGYSDGAPMSIVHRREANHGGKMAAKYVIVGILSAVAYLPLTQTCNAGDR